MGVTIASQEGGLRIVRIPVRAECHSGSAFTARQGKCVSVTIENGAAGRSKVTRDDLGLSLD
jgi:hypothetical protein